MSQCPKCGCQVEDLFTGKTVIHDVERCAGLAPAHCSRFPQLRDNMATRTRELWRNESTLDYAMTEIETNAVPPHWNMEWRMLWAMPFGTYENPFTLTSLNTTMSRVGA